MAGAGYITLFTGTPLLVQIFLIYYGPGQFPTLQEYPALWHLLSEPWLCALIALSLNSAAYTTQLFYGAIRVIPEGQCSSPSLRMSKKRYAGDPLPRTRLNARSLFQRSGCWCSQYFWLTPITLMAAMRGYSQLLYGRTYDVMVFGAAGLFHRSSTAC